MVADEPVSMLDVSLRAGILSLMARMRDDLGAGFVMDRIDGETIARRILRDDAYAEARTRLTAQCGEALARIQPPPST